MELAQRLLSTGSTLAAHLPVVVFESEGRAESEASWSVLREVGYAHIARIRSNGDDKGKLGREWARLSGGSACWLEPLAAMPDGHCNLMVSTERLPS